MNGLCMVDTETEFVVAHFGQIKIRGKSNKETVTAFFKVTDEEELNLQWFSEEDVDEKKLRENREDIKADFEKKFINWLKSNPSRKLYWDGTVLDVETIYVYQNVIDFNSRRKKKSA